MDPHRFDALARIADAVLFEGYVLYPYRASAAKNQYRWQFGVVAPRAPREDSEPWFAQTECLVHRLPGVAATPLLHVRVRCLRPRSTSAVQGAATPWLEGVPVSLDLPPLTLDGPAALNLPLEDVQARLTIDAHEVGSLLTVRLRLENLEPWHASFETDRDAMLRRSLVGAHLMLAVEHGTFESLLEPTDAARALAQQCRNVHAWPVLVGDRSQRQLMLSSPIVLYDYPAVAAESGGDLCDAAEIDEILTLRILTLTDVEKAEARRTDPRARAILDRVESMPRSELEALHGIMRSADFFNPPGVPPPQDAAVEIEGCRVTRGSHVRLRPKRRADAMDLFLKDQPATVAGVYRDVDDRTYVAVTVDADPGAALHESFGRFFYFDPSEIEPSSPECL